ncbi:uncharacterized protein LOC106936977 [Poecilia latipinna]|uniref:uncharacterized protein LOC106936977 n=1 Tax=Poecilia latipinna TaxID=48699 RepID=UPI00072E62D8|nr:PREDICTED: uncharacterized protein LOC106936977 [Poecilia latipinna]
MYLENSEQGKVGGDGEVPTGAILSGQCVVSKVTGVASLSSSSKGSELDIKALVGYTEQSVSRGMDPPPLCNMNAPQTQLCKDCEGPAESFEEYSSSNGHFEPDGALEDTECAGLSRLYHECPQHCECFKACKSSEHCANHSLASKSSLCGEHCPEHLLLFQQCKPSDQQSDSSDYEPDESEVNSDSFGESEMPGFVSECTENLKLPLDHQCEDSDSEQDRSIEDSEQNFTQNISDSMDSLTCAVNFSEYDESQDNDCDEEEESYDCNEMEVSDEESTLSEDTPGDPCESDGAEENIVQTSTGDASEDVDELHGDDSEDESSQHDNFESCAEEDLSSDDSKSFKTCLDNSFPSDPCLDSSEESDKAAQDDSSDEPMQWESFEENDAEKHPSIEKSSEEDKKKTSAVDTVIEDYFDLFDRADCSGQAFAQKQNYISCFDGGDIHHHLHLEQEALKQSIKTAHKEETTEVKEQEKDVCTEVATEINTQEKDERCEDSEEEDLNQRDSGSCGLENWTLKSELSSTKDEAEDNEPFGLYPEYYQDSEDDEMYYDDEAWGYDGQICDYDEEPEYYLDSFRAESTFAPCAQEISVEGDVCEDKDSVGEDIDSEGEVMSKPLTETTSDVKDDKNPDAEPDGFSAFSEMEPYWTLTDKEQTRECFPAGVEDYYAYQIRSIQSSDARPLTRFILDSRSSDGKDDDDQGPEDVEESSIMLGMNVLELIHKEQSLEPENELQGISDLAPHLGVIHNVASKHEATASRDSEEEQSDDETIENCECEYCIPRTQQVPVKPLLSQSASDDPAKICVVIDLDETLVHSSFKPLNNADFIIPVEIEGIVHQVHVLKRPHVDEFLQRMGEMFECVLFTASLSKYADPVSDLLDKGGAFQSRLFREACVYHRGNYVKDLSRLGRDLNRVIIIDNSPASYIFHPDNAVPVVSWFDDMSDTELLDLIPFFERLSKVDDIYDILRKKKTSS